MNGVTAIKEHPLILTDHDVQAIRKGLKTQVRTPIKPQPKLVYGRTWVWPGDTIDYSLCWGRGVDTNIEDAVTRFSQVGQIGDRLWVREKWDLSGMVPVLSFASGGKGYLLEEFENQYRFHGRFAMWRDERDQHPDGDGWRPSITMPRWASRLTLEITGIHLEQVTVITEADARAEAGSEPNSCAFHKTARGCFAAVWNAKYAEKGLAFESAPWAWVRSFRVLEDRT